MSGTSDERYDDEDDVPFRDASASTGNGSGDTASGSSGRTGASGQTSDGGGGGKKESGGAWRTGWNNSLGDSIGPDIGAFADEARRFVGNIQQKWVEPLVKSYPDVRDHLSAAGAELAAAYRSILRDQERRWNKPPSTERVIVERVDIRTDQSTPAQGDQGQQVPVSDEADDDERRDTPRD
jgi:hypothetical protein